MSVLNPWRDCAGRESSRTLIIMRLSILGRSFPTKHSLSVSDIIAIRQNGVVSCHYVDSIGFRTLPEFLKPENYLKNAEMSMEDDYGMIDGIVNNGKADRVKEAESQRPSVLEQLKAEPAALEHPEKIRKPEERNIG